MVKNKKEFAFSLAEALISMMIMAIIAIGLLPILGKQKAGSGHNPTTVLGAFLCYWDGNDLKQVLVDGRREDANNSGVVNGSCVLRENKRAGRFYYLAAGAGSSNAAGQIITGYTTEISGDIEIIPGKAGGNADERETTIFSSGMPFTANSGYDNNNGIISNNVKDCKYVSGCPSECISDTEGESISCQYAANEDGYAFIQIQGCNCSGYESVYASELVKSSQRLSGNFNANNMQYTHIHPTTGLAFNIELKDSSYDNEGADRSHMAEILTNLSALRQNKYIDTMIKLQPGKKGSNGAAIILW